MRLAVVSDIHGNYRALQAVLSDIEEQRCATIISLGDNVGYGPEPEEVVRTLVEHDIRSVRGNHELALNNPDYYRQLNSPTRLSLDITRSLLSEESLAWLTELPTLALRSDARFVHGCPPDSTTTYLLNPTESRLSRIFGSYNEFLCFAGHTHTLDIYTSYQDRTTDHLSPITGTTMLDRNNRYLVVPGSVGQPRDLISNRAKYAVWDQEIGSVEIRAVDYDVETTVRLILERGFPSSNARRLER